jgi:hypothetical protein
MSGIEKLSIANCCEGQLSSLFDDAVADVQKDISRRPFPKTRRKITLSVEFEIAESGQITVTCASSVKLPDKKRSGLCRMNHIGELEQIIAVEEPELPFESDSPDKQSNVTKLQARANGDKE